jgi:predicted RNase H-like nuclease (RuvC/YqgF family)
MGAFFKNLFKNEFKEYEQEVARLQIENVELKKKVKELEVNWSYAIKQIEEKQKELDKIFH